MRVDLLDFLRSGRFGSVQLGMSRAQLFLFAGLPTQPSPEATFWNYGNIEFHFVDDRLYLIHTEPFHGILDGGPTIDLNLWKLQPGITLHAVEEKLTNVGIEYHKSAAYGIHFLLVGTGITLGFNNESGADSLPGDLVAISYRAKNAGLQCSPTLFPLEELLKEILRTPLSLLSKRYFRQRHGNEALCLLRLKADQIIASESDESARGETVRDEVLFALWQKLRGTKTEQVLWQALIPALLRPLPLAIARDLLDRKIAFNALEHTRQADEVQWRLANSSEAVVLRLAKECYLNSEQSVSDFTRLLQTFSASPKTLTSLLELEPTSLEKEQILLTVVRQQPDAFFLFHVREVRLMIVRAQRQPLNLADAQTLYATGEPKVLRALASNPSTPRSLLLELARVKNIAYASEIRNLAQETRKIQKRFRES